MLEAKEVLMMGLLLPVVAPVVVLVLFMALTPARR